MIPGTAWHTTFADDLPKISRPFQMNELRIYLLLSWRWSSLFGHIVIDWSFFRTQCMFFFPPYFYFYIYSFFISKQDRFLHHPIFTSFEGRYTSESLGWPDTHIQTFSGMIITKKWILLDIITRHQYLFKFNWPHYHYWSQGVVSFEKWIIYNKGR